VSAYVGFLENLKDLKDALLSCWSSMCERACVEGVCGCVREYMRVCGTLSHVRAGASRHVCECVRGGDSVGV